MPPLDTCADLLGSAEFAAVKPLQTSAYLAAEPGVVIDVLLNQPLNVLIRPAVDFRGRAVELGLHFRSEMDLHQPSVAPARPNRRGSPRVEGHPLIIEVLSPSNRPAKLERQRLAAFSGGTREFWVVDPQNRAIEVFVVGKPSRVYGLSEEIPVTVLAGVRFPVRDIFPD